MEYQEHLIKDKRFWPSFWTQFFGAFNDNVFKNALVILIAFQTFSLMGLNSEQMVALCGGIFILPFFLFSALAGQICDKYPKDKLMFYIKVWEVIVMLIGSIGFLLNNVSMLLVTLFLMGLQSTFFGPVKYSILPELINDDELVHGTALVEMGTFVSILLGTILGGLLIGLGELGRIYVSIGVVTFALIGVVFSMKIRVPKRTYPSLKINFGLIKPTWDVIQIARKKKSVFLSVIGISWFWFLGASLLSLFPVYAQKVLNSNEHVVTLFLALFSIGVGVGSVLCEKLSRKRLELGLVPFGTIGMSLFIFDLFLVGSPNFISEVPFGLSEFFSHQVSYRIVFDLLGLSVFSGFFIVPLYTIIQQYSDKELRSRVIAANNIINAFFMVVASLLLTLFYALGLSIPEIYLILAVFNLLASAYIYSIIPEFLLRFCAMIVTRIMYRLKVKGHENIPDEGACIITCNHVSYVDWLVVSAAVKRPIRFVMWYKFMQIPIIKFFFRDAKVIPIAGANENRSILLDAMKEIDRAIENGDIICIFPEGAITSTGKLSPFKTGIEKIVEGKDIPVIPMTLNGLWGSFFSRVHKKKAMSSMKIFMSRWFSKVDVEIYPAWKSQDITAKKIEEFTNEKLDY